MMLGVEWVAAVAVNGTDYGYDRRYKYIVPAELSDKAAVGARVIIPFGKGNRKRVALIIRLDDANLEIELSNLKPIISVIDDKPLINEEMLSLIKRMREDVLCTYFDAFKTLIPIGLSVDEDGKRKISDKKIRMLRISDEYLNGEIAVNISPKQKAVLALLEETESASVRETLYICNVTISVVNALINRGVLTEYEHETVLPVYDYERCQTPDIALNEEQAKVYSGIAKLIDSQEPHAALLFGVTGSGKTLVYAKLIEHTLNMDKSAILMLPEISLTPQVVNRFKLLFGNTVAVFHSGLSLTERLNEYNRVKNGAAKLVIGTRSAVFAPLENIGIIIMDEEGEHSYKSMSSPRYNTADVAKIRAVTHNAVLLLGSATPSVCSYYYALNGRYKLFSLPHRYNKNVLPKVSLIDLAADGFCNGSKVFSATLFDEITQNLANNEQTILLLNRRGYHTLVMCSDCKKPVTCVNCSVPMTYHKTTDRLHCHFCGSSRELPSECPDCKGDRLRQTGVGTQLVEDEMAFLFPNARILRMDADSAYSRSAYEKNFAAFKAGEYDIMVGTQMIAKGLDFPNVTLVGVLSIDKALFTGDYKSYERTFSLVTQVVGRCGRSEKQGRAVIQTYMPEHYVLNLAAMQDYEGFYKQEIALRKALILPPFCDTCLLEFSSVMSDRANIASKSFIELLKNKITAEKLNLPLRVLGPAKCVQEKINGKYRYRIIIKCRINNDFKEFISELYKRTFKLKEFSNVTTSIDFNGDISI